MANEKRLIDANAVLAGIDTFMQCYAEKEKELTPFWVKVAIQALEMVRLLTKEMSTVDAVEVVRCKDCKYCLETSASSTKIACSKGVNWRAVEPNHYCSYGERKDHEASQD